jgi:hypothetical protein
MGLASHPAQTAVTRLKDQFASNISGDAAVKPAPTASRLQDKQQTLRCFFRTSRSSATGHPKKSPDIFPLYDVQHHATGKNSFDEERPHRPRILLFADGLIGISHQISVIRTRLSTLDH